MNQEQFFTIDTETVMYGVFGNPIRHSRSPVMLNAAFRHLAINAAYVAFQVEPGELKQAVDALRALKFRGVNVTIPHKQAVIPFLDRIDATAEAIGAVNTIVNDDGVLTGFNTDGIGFVRALKTETGCELAGRRILVIGAGGAARGVVFALAQENPAAIFIANRTADRAVSLAAEISRIAPCEGMGLEEVAGVEQVDVMINTTSVGMHPNTTDIPADPGLFHDRMIVSDLVYNPLQTRWLSLAEQAGARIHSGLGMFVYQGACAFEYWTGLPAPVEVMRQTVLRSFAGETP